MASESNPALVDLLNRARGGDQGARDELFNHCRSYVGLVARTQVESWMRAKVDASDLVQQTLLEAHRGFAKFQGQTEAEWLAWLRQILSHNTVDFIRRYRTDKRRVGREVPLNVPGNGALSSYFRDPEGDCETPSRILAEQEQEIELANAIAQLSDDHREVIILRNLQRLPFDEVAERMERSRPAVQMLWMRAVRRLEQILRKPEECP
ncbi:MAG: RNA polymerase subunit sigma-70 [Planctomycetota bacterium]|nr:MAG: RNA polymerase subunit sigma-70 [Planctomycetota bacterium]REJ88519.1 MAG: RNA polymerase subunit sigma-70 [Planctomycetota bacterium]REK22423.1 MAG: RNA polymerase subunit sigma-70 [Planctomycetota bacterium]REK34927.1 MAG: RNA polymerase subunit sigma-70 [Planctomycetota bacterium]